MRRFGLGEFLACSCVGEVVLTCFVRRQTNADSGRDRLPCAHSLQPGRRLVCGVGGDGMGPRLWSASVFVMHLFPIASSSGILLLFGVLMITRGTPPGRGGSRTGGKAGLGQTTADKTRLPLHVLESFVHPRSRCPSMCCNSRIGEAPCGLTADPRLPFAKEAHEAPPTPPLNTPVPLPNF